MAIKTKQTIALTAFVLIALLLVSGIASASVARMATASKISDQNAKISSVSSVDRSSSVRDTSRTELRQVSKEPEAQTIPTEKKICKGDVNLDGKVNFGDINPFRWVLNNPERYKANYPRRYWAADINSDGLVNAADVNPFVALLSNPTAGICS
jgi:hypothetical protein